MPTLAGQEPRVQQVFVASNRLPRDTADIPFFGQRLGDVRDPTLRYGRVDLSIPPAHATGRIEWPGSETPDPQRHFLASANMRYTGAPAFLRALDEASPGSDVVVFVHGFNVNSAEAIYRLGQVAVDYAADDPVIAFSWPSAGSPRGYVYDRDSVMFARDGLEELLTTLVDADHGVLLVTHSMGSQLVMETLRQMSISGKGRVLSRLTGVALISPDIDEDVFVRQASRISPMPQPFALLISGKDRVLELSALLTGKPTRLGSIDDPSRLDDLPVSVIDLSAMSGGVPGGHLTAFTAPEAILFLAGLAAQTE